VLRLPLTKDRPGNIIMSYLVDANVLCEATRLQADPRVLRWLDQHDTELHASVITLGEIKKGIHLLTAGRKR
jgi:toxin FitB